MRIIILLLVLMCAACQPMPTAAPHETSTSAPTAKPSATVTQTVMTLCGDANLRESPAPVGDVLGWKRVGERVKIFETRGGWARIDRQHWITEKAICQ